jgi:hypothetical protein
MTVTNQNWIQDEIEGGDWNRAMLCYHSFQNLLSSRLLSKKVKIRIYRTIILPVVLYGCETCSLILREEHRLRVFENRVLRRIFRSLCSSHNVRDQVSHPYKLPMQYICYYKLLIWYNWSYYYTSYNLVSWYFPSTVAFVSERNVSVSSAPVWWIPVYWYILSLLSVRLRGLHN